MYIGAATMENSIEIYPKIKIVLPCDPEIPFLSVYLKQTKC